MIEAYVEQVKPIPARIIESVGRELDLDMQPFPVSATDPPGMLENHLAAAMSSTIGSIVDSTNSMKERES